MKFQFISVYLLAAGQFVATLPDPYRYQLPLFSKISTTRGGGHRHVAVNAKGANFLENGMCSASSAVDDSQEDINQSENKSPESIIPPVVKAFVLPWVMAYLKAKIKTYNEFKAFQANDVRFNDVAGCDEAKHELSEILEFIRSPERFKRMGAKLPRGVLLCGPPGTGKTLMAKAMAGEAGCAFISCAGSDFTSEYAGVGTAAVKRLFAKARQYRRCIIFVDEIDTIGRKRTGMSSSVAMDGESTLNQLLVEMDGFNSKSKKKGLLSRCFSSNGDTGNSILVLAGTNRPSMLDPALMRAGRFDRIVNVNPPDIMGRRALFSMYMKALPLAFPQNIQLQPTVTPTATTTTDDASVPSPTVQREDLETQSRLYLANSLAAMTPGFTGAQIANTCNEAALRAATSGSETVNMTHFSDALDRIQGGLERTRAGVPPHELRRTAVHEAGHAIMAWFQTHSPPPIKVSVVWRGDNLGFMQHKVFERTGETALMLQEKMACLLGGRVAEELIYGDADTGASNDLQRVTDIAYYLVGHLGFSERVGQLAPLSSQLGGQRRELSEETNRLIDAEARRTVKAAYAKAKALLRSKMTKLKAMTAALVEEEVLQEDRIRELLGPRPSASLTAAAPYEEANLPLPPVIGSNPTPLPVREKVEDMVMPMPATVEKRQNALEKISHQLRKTAPWVAMAAIYFVTKVGHSETDSAV